MISFWENDSFTNYNLIVVGSGIVGLTTAIEYKEKHPNNRVLIVEKGTLPSGASTKNAGFACFGSLTEICDDLKNMPKEEVISIVEKRFKGLNNLRIKLGDDALDFKQLGGYELITEEQAHYVTRMEEINALLYPIFNDNVFSDRSDDIGTFGFNKDKVQKLLFNKFEGQIHTGKMMSALLKIARQLDIEIITGTKIEEFYDLGDKVICSSYNNRAKIDFYANKCCICVNAFTQQLLPQLEVTPGRGQVLITHPIKNLPFKGTFHMDRGYYYFRNYGDRVIIGGGRHLDYDGETTTELKTTKPIIENLISILNTTILPNTPYKIDTKWAGIMAFGDKKTPIIKLLSDRIAIGVRMGGMGVAIGSQVGIELAHIVSNLEHQDQ
ncbi:FAD-binding oxidoreductase [Flammeovirga pectinis]|uniref:FAD-binding oxidoreductase n=1 Tax=Flammeovirga pectinis TaxID=2494373 RepID=A0A3S9NZN0_9BACT|nr:FAD-dependent oxidoreductase [Flammeovirga pectinis]AZQ61389.1 FAD-binding oxidoreductase [Flammeovirga pectinis]